MRPPVPILLVLLIHINNALSAPPAARPKALTGRFVHLTDMHPDPFYLYNRSQAAACHFDKPASGDRAGYWGSAVSDCDAPLNLVNATFDWLKTNFHGEVDFVVWTGDNARHDIDSKVPRSLPEIFRLNRYVAERIRDTFGKVPVVASIGNNDIYPHNIMFPGPSTVTSEFLDIWKHYIPENHLHTFARGGYYSIDAIPNQLLLISLNTLYMYDNNKAVDGCPVESSGKGDIDPGTEQLQWLEQQLLLARMRKMQVWLTGHVPATEENWYPMCYQRYGELVLSYHDTIVGHLFGHMNVDHFNFIRASSVLRKPKKDKSLTSSSSSSPRKSPPSYSPFHAADIAENLRESYLDLPRKKKTNLSDFGVVNVNPSVIPTYLPAVRIWQYNITMGGLWAQGEMQDGSEDDIDEEQEEGEDDEITTSRMANLKETLTRTPSLLFSPSTTSFASLFTNDDLSSLKKKKKHKKKKHPKHPYPRLPRYYDPNSPSCTNTYLSPLGYTQYYIDLEKANKHSGYGAGPEGKRLLKKHGDHGVRPPPTWQIEYTTYKGQKLAAGLLGLGDQPSPIPHQLLPDDLAELVASGVGEDPEAKVVEVADLLKKHGLVPYKLKDLTIGSWIKLARKLGVSKKAWKGFVDRMYVSSS